MSLLVHLQNPERLRSNGSCQVDGRRGTLCVPAASHCNGHACPQRRRVLVAESCVVAGRTSWPGARYHTLSQQLVAKNMSISQRVSNEPEFRSSKFHPVPDVMKDLGVDSTLGRLRRTGVQRGSLVKGLRRALRLSHLPAGKRIALLRSNVYPAALWGHRAIGFCLTTYFSQASPRRTPGFQAPRPSPAA